MGLIDAGAFKRYIEDCEFCHKCPNRTFRCEITCEMPSYLTKQWERAIDEQPTVDVVSVKHGKWIPREEGIVYPFWARYTCSECGTHWDDTLYCPNCGARMDEDETD